MDSSNNSPAPWFARVGCALFFIAFLLIFTAYVAPDWIEVNSARAPRDTTFRKLGLWMSCYTNLHDPYYYDPYLTSGFEGCRWIYYPVVSTFGDLRDFLLPSFIIPVQITFSLCFVTCLLLFFMVLVYLFKYHTYPYLIVMGMVTEGAGLLGTISVIVFGSLSASRTWAHEWQFNDLSWAFTVAVIGVVLLHLVGILFLLEAYIQNRNKKKRVDVYNVQSIPWKSEIGQKFQEKNLGNFEKSSKPKRLISKIKMPKLNFGRIRESFSRNVELESPSSPTEESNLQRYPGQQLNDNISEGSSGSESLPTPIPAPRSPPRDTNVVKTFSESRPDSGISMSKSQDITTLTTPPRVRHPTKNQPLSISITSLQKDPPPLPPTQPPTKSLLRIQSRAPLSSIALRSAEIQNSNIPPPPLSSSEDEATPVHQQAKPTTLRSPGITSYENFLYTSHHTKETMQTKDYGLPSPEEFYGAPTRPPKPKPPAKPAQKSPQQTVADLLSSKQPLSLRIHIQKQRETSYSKRTVTKNEDSVSESSI